MIRLLNPALHGVGLSANYFDADHHALLKAFDALARALASENRALVLETTSALIEVSRGHFEREEQRMRESGYRATARHCANHRKLLQSLADFHQKVGLAKDFSTVLGASKFLEQWLAPHIANDDKRFSEFLNARDDAKKVGHP